MPCPLTSLGAQLYSQQALTQLALPNALSLQLSPLFMFAVWCPLWLCRHKFSLWWTQDHANSLGFPKDKGKASPRRKINTHFFRLLTVDSIALKVRAARREEKVTGLFSGGKKKILKIVDGNLYWPYQPYWKSGGSDLRVPSKTFPPPSAAHPWCHLLMLVTRAPAPAPQQGQLSLHRQSKLSQHSAHTATGILTYLIQGRKIP